jgi:hypothetical protein
MKTSRNLQRAGGRYADGHGTNAASNIFRDSDVREAPRLRDHIAARGSGSPASLQLGEAPAMRHNGDEEQLQVAQLVNDGGCQQQKNSTARR